MADAERRIERVFLAPGDPPLVQAARWLARTARVHGRALELRDWTCVLPGAQAGRQLVAHLVDEGQQRGLALVPPTITTAGALPDVLAREVPPVATELMRRLAWTAALRGLEPARARRLLGELPEASERGWARLGALVCALHADVASVGLELQEAAERAAIADGMNDADRWDILVEVRDDACARLERAGRVDPYEARLAALRAGRVASDAQVALIGVVELSPLSRAMLAHAASIHALVHAPATHAALFDALGVPSSGWLEQRIPLDDARLEVVHGPADQAARSVAYLADLGDAASTDEVAIGVLDADALPYLRAHLGGAHVGVHDAAGAPLRAGGVYRLLGCAAQVLESDAYAGIAELVRHPAVDAWLRAQGLPDACVALDRAARVHLPASHRDARGALAISTALERLLAPLSGARRALPAWASVLRAWMLEVWSDARDAETLAALEVVGAALAEHEHTDASLSPSVTAATALHTLLDALAEARVPEPEGASAIRLLGWLELHLDASPHLLITGFHDAAVPGSVGSDPFLPMALRRALGLPSDADRHARDAYLFWALCVSRRVHVVAARHASDGTPRLPSRLLFACAPEVAARRVLRFFDARADAPRARAAQLEAGRVRSAFVVPPPRPLERPFESLPVTAFRDYLACPYRFYLRHGLGLRAEDDRADELDAGGFGSLAHDALRAFGESSARDTTDAREIADTVLGALDRLSTARFGSRPRPAVRVQIEQLRARLLAFSQWQARFRAHGWRIARVEAEVSPGGAQLDVDGAPFGLHGRIDRIDVHELTGEHLVLDYKTGDGEADPERAHRRGDAWVDLQLPLYRHLVRALGISGGLRFGYVTLPRELSRAQHVLAGWTAAELADADETARRVVRGVRDERFWPPVDPPPAFASEYAPICQDGQIVEDEEVTDSQEVESQTESAA